MSMSQAISSEYALDENKLRQMIFFFLSRGDNTLGKTKLMKLLYYSDFGHFVHYGQAISGAEYIKLPQGPVPYKAMKMLDKLARADVLTSDRIQVGSMVRHAYGLADNTEFDTSELSAAEIETLERVWKEWGAASTSEIVEASHRELGWLSTPLGSVIPYHTALFG